MYSYDPAGRVKKKRLLVFGKRTGSATIIGADTLEATYGYDPEGHMTSHAYPAAHELTGTAEVAGANPTYAYDSMGRPQSMPGFIDSVEYNEAGQPKKINTSNPLVAAEERVYNQLGQLTSLKSGAMRFEYDFRAAGANDGRITTQRTYSGAAQIDTNRYQYDSLNRLSYASGASWGASYRYDGFGSLWSVGVSGTNGPSPMSVAVDGANRVSGWNYDLNGNVIARSGFTGVYDIENRLVDATGTASMHYGYGADNRRIYESKRVASNGATGDTIEEYVTYWAGKRIGRYKIRWDDEAPTYGSPNTFVFAKVEENLYFGSKPLPVNGAMNVVADRLGSIRTGKDYYPYGQENAGSGLGADKEKYATYKHDSATDLSYADQRYYATGAGRFMTADPYQASAGPEDPGSRNRYAYVGGDPVNFNDQVGLARAPVRVDTAPIQVTVSFVGVPIEDIIGNRRLRAWDEGGTFTPIWLERELLEEERCSRSQEGASEAELDSLLGENMESEEREDIEALITPPDDKDDRREIVPYAMAALTGARWIVYMAQTPTGQRYIGITTNFATRAAQHGQRFVVNGVNTMTQLQLPSLTYAQAKGVEQYLIGAARSMNVGLANRYNSVSPGSKYYLDFFRRGLGALNCNSGARQKAFSYLNGSPIP